MFKDIFLSICCERFDRSTPCAAAGGTVNEDFKKVECPNLEHKKRGFLGGMVCQNETII
jgi:hypothetical protein